MNYEIGGKAYPASRYIGVKNNGALVGVIPVLDIPMVSDYKWQFDCLKKRIEHPEWYEGTEDVEAEKARLIKWLDAHKNDAFEGSDDDIRRICKTA